MLRLKTRPQFQAVLASTVVAKSDHFSLHRYRLQPPLAIQPGRIDAQPLALFEHQAVWMGALVPKRWAKRAVTRNAIKRQIYAISEGCDGLTAPAAYVVRLRKAYDRKIYVSASSESLKCAVRGEVEHLLSAAVDAQ